MKSTTAFEWVTVLRFLAKRVSRPAMRNTLIAVTLFVAVIAGLAYVHKGGVYVALCNITIFAFIGKCNRPLRFIVPGTLSAAVVPGVGRAQRIQLLSPRGLCLAGESDPTTPRDVTQGDA